MIVSSTHKRFNIGFCSVLKKYLILSKHNKIVVGGFTLEKEAIEFAEKRFK